MRASRGMGAIAPSKMPKAKTITRKDDPNKVTTFKRGGKVKRYDEGGGVDSSEMPRENGVSRDAASEELPMKLGKAGDDYETRFGVKNIGGMFTPQQKALMGRLTASKKLSPSSELSAYADAMISKGMGHSAKAGLGGYGVEYRKTFANGGDVWDEPRPKEIGKPKTLTPAKKATAKASAKKAGRKYPNLIDNMRAARK